MILAWASSWSGSIMWAIIRKPTASMPSCLAMPMCCSAMSASVQCVAMRATWTPRSAMARRSSTVPMPGISRQAIFAFLAAATAALTSLYSSVPENP